MGSLSTFDLASAGMAAVTWLAAATAGLAGCAALADMFAARIGRSRRTRRLPRHRNAGRICRTGSAAEVATLFGPVARVAAEDASWSANRSLRGR